MKTSASLILALVISVCVAGAAPNAAGPEGKAPAKAAPASEAPIEIPKSQFIIPASPSEGRDPFFPESMRLFASQVRATSAKASAPAPAVLVLKAISASGNRRVASINNRPFEAGEEGEVVIGNSRVRVRCVEVREDRVLVEVEGQPQELRLRAGF
ncbi:MAG: hypothetical protein ACK45B_01400 [Limisphaerales bacterium]